MGIVWHEINPPYLSLTCFWANIWWKYQGRSRNPSYVNLKRSSYYTKPLLGFPIIRNKYFPNLSTLLVLHKICSLFICYICFTTNSENKTSLWNWRQKRTFFLCFIISNISYFPSYLCFMCRNPFSKVVGCKVV